MNPRPGYADLTPQQVLDALDAVGLRGDGRILQLNSYENRVYQLFLEDGSAVVAKFYRPGRWSDAQILEEHAFALELAAAEVPVVPPLVLTGAEDGVALAGTPPTLALQGAHRWSVSARCAGREPELDDPETLRRIGRFIGRLHAVGRRCPFEHRHRLDARADGRRALALLVEGGFVPADQLPAWQASCEQALAAVEAAFDAAQPLATLRLHGDCHPGNVLWRDGSPHVVDLDDAMQGPAVQDLWMLVSGDRSTIARQLDTLIAGYEEFSEFDDRERVLIEPLRTLRMVRHAAWLAERWSDPSFPINFPYFGSSAYWSQQTTQLREQLEAMG
ncbi:serine/threonine protein kinase [Rubrivivax gelatinosus]|uniref:Stress response kinase A n=1 Tax=Rubrivivax gelatinosus (strain NBRC 100245 / IL144) TaxID=983917 RepID=I0HM61_RUBGI|nr:serine/threonine protein kinase [Rubrivivax gelatinosus]BAL94098.1 aminoglycoside phosphotransferase [Rubrivivax gelatinosus IL144]